MNSNSFLQKLLILCIAQCLLTFISYAQQNSTLTFASDTFINHVEAISHDSTKGRSTPSQGLEATAHYIAFQFQKAGLIPYGDEETFFQRYPLKEMSIDKDKTVINSSNGSLHWKYIEDFTRRGGGGIFRPGVSSGKLVVVAGYNLDMDKIESANLDGKIVLYIQPVDINKENPSAGIINIFQIASQGAKMVLMSSLRTNEQWTSVKNNSENYLTPYIESGWQDPKERKKANVSFLEVRSTSIDDFLSTLELDFSELSNPEEDFFFLQNYEDEITINIDVSIDQLSLPANVIGLIEGSDPKLKDEYIVYTAHYDHLGLTKDNRSDDEIYNGADDNASGTSALIMLAEAFSNLPDKPKRSIIFNAVSGEEIGLIGSEYFVKKFSLVSQRIVANINADMIGSAFRSDTLFALGLEYSSLGDQLASLNATSERPLKILNTAQTDSIYTGQELFRRSDHYNFILKYIPSLFLFTGLHDQYHEPGDHADILHPETSIRIIELMYQLGLNIAENRNRPIWKVSPESLIFSE